MSELWRCRGASLARKEAKGSHREMQKSEDSRTKVISIEAQNPEEHPQAFSYRKWMRLMFEAPQIDRGTEEGLRRHQRQLQTNAATTLGETIVPGLRWTNGLMLCV